MPSRRTKPNRSQGFTLVEVMIVVLIMAILSARVVSEFSMSSEDAALAAVHHSEDQLTRAITRYRLEHNGALPVISSQTLPQLFMRTNISGATGTSPSTHPFGPYVTEIPVNSISNSAIVTATNENDPNVANFVGWIYNPTTGRIWGGTKTSPSGGGGC